MLDVPKVFSISRYLDFRIPEMKFSPYRYHKSRHIIQFWANAMRLIYHLKENNLFQFFWSIPHIF